MSNQPPYGNPPGGYPPPPGGGYPPPGGGGYPPPGGGGYPPPPSFQQSDAGFGEFLAFRKMITPVIIQIIFWILLVLVILGGLFIIIAGASSPYGGGGGVIIGLLYIIIGPLIVRIYCELLIIIFRIHDVLTDIRRELQRR